MNPDGSFCLGFRAPTSTIDHSSRLLWWKRLAVFLSCQETAHETRCWPELMQISHGRAGEIELEAEAVAAQLGLLTEYHEAVRYNTGPIDYYVTRIKSGRLLNGRQTCVCGRIGRRARVRLRRECWKAEDQCLPLMEAQRRLEEKKFWHSFKGRKCCGTMISCPLRQLS